MRLVKLFESFMCIITFLTFEGKYWCSYYEYCMSYAYSLKLYVFFNLSLNNFCLMFSKSVLCF